MENNEKTVNTNMEPTVDTNVKLNFWQRLAYSFGAFSVVGQGLISAFVLLFCTNYLGLSAAIVGTIIGVSRVIDGFTDLAAGVLVDKTKSKYGKARPWFLRAAIPYGFVLVLMFFVPGEASNLVKYIWIGVCYNLIISIFSTILTVAHAAMMPLLTTDMKERSVLALFWTFMTQAPMGIFASFLVPTILKLAPVMGPLPAWRACFGVVALIIIAGCLICFFGTKEVVTAGSFKKAFTIKDLVKTLVTNKFALLGGLNSLLLYFSVGICSTVDMYYFLYYLGNVSLYTSTTLIKMAVTLIALFAFAPFIKKMGRAACMRIGCLVLILSGVLFLLGQRNAVMVIIATVVYGIGTGIIPACVVNYINDSIEYGEWKTGTRAEGVIACVRGFTQKIGMAVASTVGGIMLEAGGYDGNAAVQTEQAVQTIYNIRIWPMVIIGALMFLLAFLWTLDKKMPEINATLAEKHGGAYGFKRP